jgi:cell division protein FtsI/penicillin-binding protein 2
MMIGLFGIAALSQLKLQGLESKSTIELANKVNKWEDTIRTKAKRGAIVTRDGKALALQVTAYELSVNYKRMPKSPGLAMAMSEATGIPAYAFLDREEGSRTWDQPLTTEQYRRVKAIQKDFNADGVSIVERPNRAYPLGSFASSIVGYVKPAGKVVQKGGLELVLDKKLTGTDGVQHGLKDKSGELLPLRSYEPDRIKQDGATVETTIDSQIQIAASKAIKDAVEKNKADDGIAIVVQPKTGEILAMSCWPAADPTIKGMTELDGINPNYKSILEPGSTFKILTLAMALDAGAIQQGFMTHCTGGLSINNHSSVHCDEHHGNRAHGVVDPTLAIAKSCNVAAATWALKIGQSKYFNYLKQLGLQEKSGLGLPNEQKNWVRVDKGAPRLQLATLGFGQSMNLTPITLAGAFATIANKGRRVPLTLVKSINGKEEPQRLPKRVLSEESCAYTLECMRAVMEKGTGASIKIPGYDLAGKTGTAQKLGKGGAKGYVSNFVGVIPAKDPEALVLVMVNNPKGGKYYGAEVAGPVFTDVSRAVIKSLKIEAK